jgi:uncharacterized protein (DUF885 family)
VRVVVVALLSGSLIVSAACGRGDAGAPLEGDGALAHVLSGYVVDFLRRNPTTNTYLGGAGLDPSLRDVDGMLRDHSAEALVEEDEWLRASQRAIEAVPVESLSSPARIDREVALAQIRFLLRQHGVRRYQERALDTYVGEPFRSVDWQLQGLTQTDDGAYGTLEEWDLVVRRLRAIPQFLTTAQAQLEAGVVSRRIPDWRMARRDGLEMSEVHAKYFAEALPSLAAERLAGPARDRWLPALRTAAQEASEAYLRFRDFVAATYFDGGVPKYAADRFAMGEEEYDWAIRNNLVIPYLAFNIYETSWSFVEFTRGQMVSVARQIGGQRSLGLPDDGPGAVREALEVLAREYPRSDAEMMAWYREAAERLLDYGRKTGIVELPPDYHLEIGETPDGWQASVDTAAYYPAPPFKTTRGGRFQVAPTHGNPVALRRHSRASVAYRVARGGFPGDDWHFQALTRSGREISPVHWLEPGGVEDSSSMWQDSLLIEGWGSYAPTMIDDTRPGMPERFYTPAEQLYQLQRRLSSEVLARIDTGMHIGRLTYEGAVTLLSESVDFLPGACDAYIATAFRPAQGGDSEAKRASCERAERAVFRFSKWPTQAIIDRLDRDRIWARRGAAVTRLGDRLSLSALHRVLVRQGKVPDDAFEEVILTELDQPGS